MNNWTKIVLVIAGALIFLVYVSKWSFTFSVLDYNGKINVDGIGDSVSIFFDDKGIPQIFGKDENDVYFALGYLHASERLFQMELVRRLVAGELSEWFGNDALNVDKQNRTLGFYRKAKNDVKDLHPDNESVLHSYVTGINTYLANHSWLPPEFVILLQRPAEWTITDIVSIALYQTWYSQSIMDDESKNDLLLKTYGHQILPVLNEYKSWSPATVPEGVLEDLFQYNPFPYRLSNASNSWVARPEKSISNAALHASDPHLSINSIPGFWYIAGLRSDDGLNVVGITAPGLPYVVMGHNESIAYGFTVSTVDVIDFYREWYHPSDSTQYKAENGFKAFDLIIDTIYSSSQSEPFIHKTLISENGPIVNSDSGFAISLHWAGYDFSAADILNHAYLLQKSTDFNEFRQYVTQLGALDANWTYSDKKGNIGYQLGIPIPIRDYENTFQLLDGFNPETKWKGYHPLDQKPFAYNPENGWLATCNNQIVSEKWYYPIPGFYDNYRIVRANELLSKSGKFSADDFHIMQLDNISVVATRWKSLLAVGLSKSGQPDLAAEVAKWSGEMSNEQPLAPLFALWWEGLKRELFIDDLGDQWKSGKPIIDEVLDQNISYVIDDQRTTDTLETLTMISARVVQQLLENKVSDLSYGDIHQLEIKHPLSRVPLMDWWLSLNRGPFSLNGDHSSLNASFSTFIEEKNRYVINSGPSMRMVLDWADINSFRMTGNLGQSGHPLSPYYANMIPVWLEGKSHVVPFDRSIIMQQSKSQLQLISNEK